MSSQKHEEVQKRVFLSFVRFQLSTHPDLPQDHINQDIESYEELHDGLSLYYFIDVLCRRIGVEFTLMTKRRLPQTRNMRSDFVKKSNVSSLVSWLKQMIGVPLVGVGSLGVVGKDEEIIMSLVSSIIVALHIQQTRIRSDMWDDIIGWVNDTLGSPHRVQLESMTDWADGVVLCDLIRAVFGPETEGCLEAPGEGEGGSDLIARCLKFANDEMSVPSFLEVEDFMDPDKIALATYLASIRNCLPFDQSQLSALTAGSPSGSGAEARRPKTPPPARTTSLPSAMSHRRIKSARFEKFPDFSSTEFDAGVESTSPGTTNPLSVLDPDASLGGMVASQLETSTEGLVVPPVLAPAPASTLASVGSSPSAAAVAHRLRKKKEKWKRQYADLHTTHEESLISHRAKLEEARERARSEREGVEEELAQTKGKLKKVSGESDLIRKSLDDAMEAIQDLEMQLESVNEEKKVLEDKVARLSEESQSQSKSEAEGQLQARLDDTMTQLEEQKQHYETELIQLRLELSEAQHRPETGTETGTETETETETELEWEKLRGRTKEAEEGLDQAMAEIASLEEMVKTKEAGLQKTKNENEALEAQLLRLREEAAEAKAEPDSDPDSAPQAGEGELASLREMYESAKTRAEFAEEQLVKVSGEVDALRMRLTEGTDTSEDELAVLKEKNSELEETVRDLQSQVRIEAAKSEPKPRVRVDVEVGDAVASDDDLSAILREKAIELEERLNLSASDLAERDGLIESLRLEIKSLRASALSSGASAPSLRRPRGRGRGRGRRTDSGSGSVSGFDVDLQRVIEEQKTRMGDLRKQISESKRVTAVWKKKLLILKKSADEMAAKIEEREEGMNLMFKQKQEMEAALFSIRKSFGFDISKISRTVPVLLGVDEITKRMESYELRFEEMRKKLMLLSGTFMKQQPRSVLLEPRMEEEPVAAVAPLRTPVRRRMRDQPEGQRPATAPATSAQLPPAEEQVEISEAPPSVEEVQLAEAKRKVRELKSKDMHELAAYRHPPELVQAILKSTLVLVGHSSRDVREWRGCRRFLVGGQLKREILAYQPDTADKVGAIRKLLRDNDRERTFQVSVAIGRIYDFLKVTVRFVLKLKRDGVPSRNPAAPEKSPIVRRSMYRWNSASQSRKVF